MPNIAYACIIAQSVEDAVREHDVVFYGTMEGCYSDQKESYIKFTVDSIWKGRIQEDYTAIYKCSKKSFFIKGKRYLAYGKFIENSDHIKVSSGVGNCSETKEIIPLWKNNIQDAWSLLYAGQGSYILYALFNTRNGITDLGKPIYKFTQSNRNGLPPTR